MTSQRKINKVKELGDFLEALEKYRGYLYLLQEKGLTKKQKTDTLELRNALLGGVGQFKVLITELTGKDQVTITTKLRGHPVDEHAVDMWLTGLRMPLKPVTIGVLSNCIDVTRIAISKLQDGIRMGIRDKQGNIIEKMPTISTEPPKAFIAHGGDSPALAKLKSFLEALGVEPIVVEEQPSEGRSIAENVDHYARQSDCAIILATKGDVDSKTGGFIPRGNVLIEIGKSQEIFKDRIIYLLQAGAHFPTNVSEKVWGRFTTQCMDDAFIKVAIELYKFGLLKSVKHPKE